MKNDYGYTNNESEIESIRQFVRDAIADGWVQTVRYDNETVDESCELRKDDFVMAVLTRTKGVGKWKYQATVHAWAPDKLTVKLKEKYDWSIFENAQTTCNLCLKTGVKTQRYSFAGRCCADCITQARKDHEQPGWCD